MLCIVYEIIQDDAWMVKSFVQLQTANSEECERDDIVSAQAIIHLLITHTRMMTIKIDSICRADFLLWIHSFDMHTHSRKTLQKRFNKTVNVSFSGLRDAIRYS